MCSLLAAFLGTFKNSSGNYNALVLQVLHLHGIIARNGVARIIIVWYNSVETRYFPGQLLGMEFIESK